MTSSEREALLALARWRRAERDGAPIAERVRLERAADAVITPLLAGPPERLRDALAAAEGLAELLPNRRGAR